MPPASRRRIALCGGALVAMLAIARGAPLTAQPRPTDASTTPPTAIEEITVIGRYPGPPMWKVASGAHVLWIFGSLSPVPKGLTWDSRNVERVIERSQGVIGDMEISARTYNPIKIIGLVRDARRLSRNADKAPLAEVLPPELYARYAALHDRYTPRDRSAEKLRPALAALKLYGAALDDAGLTSDRRIDNEIERLAKRSDAAMARPEVAAEPRDLLTELEAISAEAERTCFATVMESIETDLEAMKARANAWALGDVAALRRFDYPDAQGDCVAMLLSAGGIEELRDELYAKWLAEAERALATHATSFAALPMRELFAADGLLAQLAAKGYAITEP